MGLTSTFSIAERGLQIAQAAMEVISHNIANVNTEGYSRQTLNLSTAYPWDSMYGPMGTGVQGDNITRAYDRFIVQNLIDKNSLLAKYEAEKTAIDSIEAVFNESNGNGINEALSDFWNAWQELANNPEGNPERLNLLEKAQTLASHIEITRQDLDNIRADINTRIEEGIDYVNELVKSIASLNDQIVAAEAGENQHANDLRDQRDQYIQELGSLMDIDYYEDPRNGAVAVLTPKGTPLVMDNAYWQLQAEADANDNIQVLWTRHNGGTVNITENIETGNLGGWIEIRDDIMNEIYAQFEAFTEGLITEVNRVHTQGVGLAKYTDVTSTYDLSDNAANVLEFSGNDNDIVISALTPGMGPENVGIRVLAGAIAGSIEIDTTFDAATSTYNITVTVPINAAGQVTVTAEEVVEAINRDRSPNLASPPPYPPTTTPLRAGDLIQASVVRGQSGTGLVTSLVDPNDPAGPPLNYVRLNHNLENVLPYGEEISYGYEFARYLTRLNGDDNDLIITALEKGAPGEDISIEYVDPGAASQPLSVAVTGNRITVNLATDLNGTITTTAEQVMDLLNSDAATRNLVAVEREAGQNGLGRVTAMSEQYLDRSGSFDLVTYDEEGQPTFNRIVVNPDDTREDILAQIGSTVTDGVIGVSAELVEDSGRHYIRIQAADGYEFAFANDNASALTALGLNTFFEGHSASTIQVNDVLMNDVKMIATGLVDANGLTETGDNVNALDLANVKDKKFAFHDQYSTINEAYNSVSANVGATAHTITSNHDFNQSLVNQIYAQRDMVSAVNLDEEMADLLKFQYMYQATAKLISVTDELLQTLLAVK
jgi:flagellar hook-associated protein 1 FlgK